MSVRNILTDLITYGALTMDNSSQVNQAIFRINQAAKELYDGFDLQNSQFEQLFQLPQPLGQQLTLPSYVGQFRAVRFSTPGYKVTLNDMIPRYQPERWESSGVLNYRIKDNVPTMQEITNSGQLRFVFKAAVTARVIITVNGKTTLSSGTVEHLCFEIGDTEHSTVNSFELATFAKNIYTDFDCDVYDIDDVLLATIENNQLDVSYIWFQLGNLPSSFISEQVTSPYEFVEILFKKRYIPLIQESDCFMCGNQYDKAIYYKYRSMECANETGKEGLAIGFDAEAKRLITELEVDRGRVIERKIMLGSNPVMNAYRNMKYDGGYSGYVVLPNNY